MKVLYFLILASLWVMYNNTQEQKLLNSLQKTAPVKPSPLARTVMVSGDINAAMAHADSASVVTAMPSDNSPEFSVTMNTGKPGIAVATVCFRDTLTDLMKVHKSFRCVVSILEDTLIVRDARDKSRGFDINLTTGTVAYLTGKNFFTYE